MNKRKLRRKTRLPIKREVCGDKKTCCEGCIEKSEEPVGKVRLVQKSSTGEVKEDWLIKDLRKKEAQIEE